LTGITCGKAVIPISVKSKILWLIPTLALIILIVTLFLFLHNRQQKPATPWAWQVTNVGGDLWLTSLNDGVPQFDYRVGAGGCIAEMRWCANANEDLFTPAYYNGAGEQTDNVIHWVFWAPDISCDSGVYDERFNINQAGSRDEYAQLLSLNVKDNVIDIYVNADKQFIPANDAPFAPGLFAHWIRYTLLDQGIIQVEHAALMPRIFMDGVDQGDYNGYFENWSTFWAAPAKFGGLALELSADGTPAKYFTAPNGDDGDIPQYDGDYVQNTDGYMLVYSTADPGSRPAVAFVLGKQPGVGFGMDETATERWNSWSIWGILTMNPITGVSRTVAPGSVLYDEYRIVPSVGLNGDFAALLNEQVSQVPPAAVYAPGYEPGGDLGTVFAALRGNVDKTGPRTYQLGSFVEPDQYIRP